MAETTKCRPRYERDGYFEKYFTGRGLDIGAGDDPITSDCDVFEKESPDNGTPPAGHRIFQGDAHRLYHITGPEPVRMGDGKYDLMETIWEIPNYDFIYTSHVLEHLEDPIAAIRKWFSHLEVGGILFIAVPHRDYYERKRLLPSRWNADHKSFWLLAKHDPPHTWGLKQVIEDALDGLSFEIVSVTEHVDPNDLLRPVTEHSGGEYQIEAIVRKLPQIAQQ